MIKRLFLIALFCLPVSAEAQIIMGRRRHDYSPANYTALRAQTCSVGETALVTDSQTGGLFDCVGSDPYGNGDDSTLVIAATAGGSGSYWQRSFAHGTANPIEMDWWERLANNVAATEWFSQYEGVAIGGAASDELYIRAPSSAASGVDTLYVRYNDWGTNTKHFTFEEADKAVVVYVPDDGGRGDSLWHWTSPDDIVIGGDNLYLTFLGNHPGVGFGCTTQGACSDNDDVHEGMIDVDIVTSYGGANVFTFKANITDSRKAGVTILGQQSSGVQNGRFDTATMGGVFDNSTAFINGGIWNLAYDSLVVRDPYAQVVGWDGGNAKTEDGRNIGCTDVNERSTRRGGAGTLGTLNKVSGVVALHYGTPNVNQFGTDTLGTASDDPLTVYYKDWGSTSTGIMPRGATPTGIMKHDPLWDYGRTTRTGRWVKIVELAGDYGNGLYLQAIADGLCEVGTPSNNNSSVSTPFIWRPEASRDGVAAQYITSWVDLQLEDVGTDWDGLWSGFESLIQAAGSGADDGPGTATPDRTYGHKITALSGSAVPVISTGVDTTEFTGAGSFKDIILESMTATPNSTPIPCENNYIYDTTVTDQIQVESNCTGNVVEGVTFSADANQAVMTIASGASVTVPTGAGNGLTATNQATRTLTITGSGTLTCNGSGESLPYTFTGSGNCEY